MRESEYSKTEIFGVSQMRIDADGTTHVSFSGQEKEYIEDVGNLEGYDLVTAKAYLGGLQQRALATKEETRDATKLAEEIVSRSLAKITPAESEKPAEEPK